jgi:hypothetical protein
MSEKDDRREFPRFNKEEKREYQRVVVRLEAEVSSETKAQISGWTKDISIKGIFVMCADRLPLGYPCRCRISLGSALRGAPVVIVDGKVVRCDESGVGIQFSPVAVEGLKKLREYFVF